VSPRLLQYMITYYVVSALPASPLLLAACSYAILRFDAAVKLPPGGGFLEAGWAAMFTFTAPTATTLLPSFNPNLRSDRSYWCVAGALRC
jgi:hypothetical protein